MSNPRIVFRTDANQIVGTGHFVRCLTLADELQHHDVEISFVARDLPQHFQEMLSTRGMTYFALPNTDEMQVIDELPHAQWLKTSQAHDAQQTLTALGAGQWDWIVVDHYALDHRFETRMRAVSKRIMVIDDLADRVHDCDVLLDQNFYHDQEQRYIGKVPSHARLLLGPRFALLRPEFKKMHQKVQPRSGKVRNILVSFGGVDADNLTAKTLEVLRDLKLDTEVNVVIGQQHPHKSQIQQICAQHHFNCHIQTSQMAKLMAKADVAIGAGGASNWERCCLGLPSIVISTASNQVSISDELSKLEACLYLGEIQNTDCEKIKDSIELFITSPDILKKYSTNALSITDGNGSFKIAQELKFSPRIEVLITDINHPVMSYLREWASSRGDVNIAHSSKDLHGGKFLFLVSCSEIVTEAIIEKFKHALVLHASDLPKGRGWSPHIWAVLEGKDRLTVSLIEADPKVDRGSIWLQEQILLEGHELSNEINDKIFKAELNLMSMAVNATQKITPRAQEYVVSSYYPKRTPNDSKLDMRKSLMDQFNLLRVADKDRYPAFFEHLGHKYILSIEKAASE